MRHHGCQTRIGGFRVDDGGDVYDLRARARARVCVCGLFFKKTHAHCYYTAPLGLPVVNRSPLSNPKLIFCPRAKSLIIRSTDLSSAERLEISASSVANCSCFCRSNRSLRVIVRVNAVRVSKASPTSSATKTAKKKTETAMAPENSCVTSHSASTSMRQETPPFTRAPSWTGYRCSNTLDATTTTKHVAAAIPSARTSNAIQSATPDSLAMACARCNWSIPVGTSTCVSFCPLMSSRTVHTVASGHRLRSASATPNDDPESVRTLSSVESSCSHRATLLMRALPSTPRAVLSAAAQSRSASVCGCDAPSLAVVSGPTVVTGACIGSGCHRHAPGTRACTCVHPIFLARVCACADNILAESTRCPRTDGAPRRPHR